MKAQVKVEFFVVVVVVWEMVCALCSGSICGAVRKLSRVLVPELLPYDAASVQETTQQGLLAGARISFLPYV